MRFFEALGRLGEPLAAHILLSIASLLLGLVIAALLTLWSARSPAVARVSLAIASLVQTVPALALLALFYPLLLSLSALVGGDIPALGFLPALLALSLYAVLPILRNGVTALRELDPAIIEAADGVGMTSAQKLRLVELPLVAPMFMAGIRTAAVWTIGAATLSTTVGQPSLGDPIFAGLQTQNWPLVLAGCVAAAALALLADALLALVEKGIRQRHAGAIAFGLGGFILGIAIALAPLFGKNGDVVTIGAKNFSEQYILARLIGMRLERAGYVVRYREGLGSAVIYRALTSGDIDVYVDYSGTLWTNEMKRADVPPGDVMIAQLDAWMQRTGNARLIGALGFENAYAFAMTGAEARERQIASLDDLSRAAPTLQLGSDLEFLERPEWVAVKNAYGLNFKALTAYSPTFMYRALQSGRADVISAFSSDGRIAADRLVVLTDPKGAIPGYEALLLTTGDRMADRRFVEALQPLVGAVDVDAMRLANYQVDRETEKASPLEAAQWLEKRLKSAR